MYIMGTLVHTHAHDYHILKAAPLLGLKQKLNNIIVSQMDKFVNNLFKRCTALKMKKSPEGITYTSGFSFVSPARAERVTGLLFNYKSLL